MPHSLHHITALAGDPQQNLDFYTNLLGLKLIKKTVNFDDPSTYHLFYGNESASPGSIISFLTSSQMKQGSPDTGQAVAVGFSVPVAAVGFWSDYFSQLNVDATDPFKRFGKLVIGLRDPDGLYLELIGDADVNDSKGSQNSPVPAEHAIRGLHGISIAEENYRATGQLLTESLEFEEINKEHGRVLYQANAPLGNTVEIIEDADLNGKSGKGTTHHIAFRIADATNLQRQRTRLEEIGYHVTKIEDRYYFNSVFFHEPGGALLEIATEGRGFTVDEQPEALGQILSLPPWLEGKRSPIEAELPEL